MGTSRIPGFCRLSLTERLRAELDLANRTAENVIGMFQVPLGLATNFSIDGREVFIPMATKEPSVITVANGARMACGGGGFWTSSTGPVMR